MELVASEGEGSGFLQGKGQPCLDFFLYFYIFFCDSSFDVGVFFNPYKSLQTTYCMSVSPWPQGPTKLVFVSVFDTWPGVDTSSGSELHIDDCRVCEFPTTGPKHL